jgi:hypothetical protein
MRNEYTIKLKEPDMITYLGRSASACSAPLTAAKAMALGAATKFFGTPYLLY